MPLSDEQYAARIACAVADDFAIDPNLWTTGTFARREDGTTCSTDDPRAAQFCALGRAQYYLHRTVPVKQQPNVWRYFKALGRLSKGASYNLKDAFEYASDGDVYGFNDTAVSSVGPEKGSDPTKRAKGAKAVAKFLRQGVAKTGRTCLGKTA